MDETNPREPQPRGKDRLDGNPFLDLLRAGQLLIRAVRWGAAPALRRMTGRPVSVETIAVRLRRLMEDLGVTYVKLGQYLAIRIDLLPREICNELSNLFSAVPPMSHSEVYGVVESDLRRSVASVFTHFDTVPVGSASIAQVHRAVTHDGEVVAVKVQRPNVAARLRADLRNLRRVARAADRLRLLGSMSAVELVDELTTFTLREVDFVAEASTAELVARQSWPHAEVPSVRWDLTTERVLTMEFVEGISLLAVCELAETGHPDAFAALLPGVDPGRVVDNLAHACLKQLFITGHFHGDPHPANVLIRPSGEIVFVDFGIFGQLDAEQRLHLADYVERLGLGDIDAAFRLYLGLVDPTPETNLREYRRDTTAVMSAWIHVSNDPFAASEEKITAKYQGEMLDVMRRHHVRIGPQQLLFWRALAVLDATAHRMPVDFDLMAALRRFFAQFRPTPVERLAAAFPSPSDWIAVAGARLRAPRLPGTKRRGAPVRTLTAEYRPATRKGRGRGLWAVSAALVSASLSVMTLEVPAAAAAGAAVSAVLMVTLGWGGRSR